MSNPNPARAYPDPAVTYVALDVHKLSIVAGVLRPGARQAEIVPLENTERAIRRFLRRLGEPGGELELRAVFLDGQATLSVGKDAGTDPGESR